MYEVLLAIDDSTDRASALARAVADLPADADDVHVTLFHVYTGDNPEGASVAQLAAARRAAEILEDAGVEAALDESSGDPADEILAAADRRDADLVVVAGRRRSPAGKAIFGSTSQAVLLRSERPVLFVGTDAGGE